MRAALGVLLVALCWPRAAAAIPAFARKYTAPCALCHAPGFPALNRFGRQFKERGYEYEPPGETPFRARNLRPDPEQKLELLPEAPLALRVGSRFVVTPSAREAGTNTLDLRPFESLYLVAGASLYPNVSLFASTTLAPAAIHQAVLGFHDLGARKLGEGAINVRLGRLLLFDFMRPEHRFVTGFGNPIATTALGANPVVPDASQPGLAIYGRVLGQRVFYHLAVLQGAVQSDGIRDADDHKDLFAELQAEPHERVRLGVFTHRGRTQITDEQRGLRVRFTDPFATVGGMAELDTAALNLFAQALWVNHDNPLGTGEHESYWGFRLEAIAPIGPRFFLLARYDQLGSHHLEEGAMKHATFHFGHLPLGNLRVAFEAAVPLADLAQASLSLAIEVAL